VAGGLKAGCGIGLLRPPGFLGRGHAPTKAPTPGVDSVLLASMVQCAARGQASVHEGLIVLFLFFAAPVSAQLPAKAALHLGGERESGDSVSQPPPVSRSAPGVAIAPGAFRGVKAPTSGELTDLAQRIAQGIGRLLERQGLLERDAENTYLAGEALDADPMASLLGPSIT